MRACGFITSLLYGTIKRYDLYANLREVFEDWTEEHLGNINREILHEL